MKVDILLGLSFAAGVGAIVTGSVLLWAVAAVAAMAGIALLLGGWR